MNDLLKRIDNGIEISFSTAFTILLLMPSGPVALFGFSNLIKILLHWLCMKCLISDFVFLTEKVEVGRCYRHCQLER